MALVTPSSRSLADATRWRSQRSHVALAVPLKQRPDAPAAPVDEGSRRERVRMELLVARPRRPARRRGAAQPPMCDISTLGRSTGVPCVRSSE